MEKSFFNNGGMVTYEGEDLSWSQRSYTCSFCKRQFNTAQALGGHMNVHRRDRARLRQLPSWVFQSHQNPNAISSSSSSSSTSLPSCNSPNPNKHRPLPFPQPYLERNRPIINSECHKSEDITIKKKCKIGAVDEGEEILVKKGFARKYEMEKSMKKKHEVISLELEIGCKDPNEVLDLELRLGYF